jgi:hypothetical protein
MQGSSESTICLTVAALLFETTYICSKSKLYERLKFPALYKSIRSIEQQQMANLFALYDKGVSDWYYFQENGSTELTKVSTKGLEKRCFTHEC